MPQVVFRRMALIRTNRSTEKYASKDGYVKMLVEAWVKGDRDMGITAYDVRRGMHIYTVPLNDTQNSLASSLQYMSQKERNDFMHVSCSVELLFSETTCTNGERRLMVEF